MREKSLVDKYRDVLSEFERKGIDVNDTFNEFGGVKAILQRIQDIEDNVAVNKEDIFKSAYQDCDIKRCVRTVINITRRKMSPTS